MLKIGKEELICDLAEFYKIYDLTSIPVTTLAVLCNGLRDNSRIKQKLAGMNCDTQTLLLAVLIDRVTSLATGKPSNLAKEFLVTDKEVNREYRTYATGEEFELARKNLLKEA